MYDQLSKTKQILKIRPLGQRIPGDRKHISMYAPTGMNHSEGSITQMILSPTRFTLGTIKSTSETPTTLLPSHNNFIIELLIELLES